MQFTRLRLRNFKCFEQIDVNFAEGATVIHGVNGSGKSSLLDACFFALYGTDSLPTGRNLESVVTKGHANCEVELWFEHAGQQYQLERELRITESQVIHDGVLKTPTGVVDGITAIEDTVVEILRMDAASFLNCAYVRQGDITRLLTASPADRQGMIDDLLQLGKLESYRERMDHARRGVDRVRRDRASKLEDVKDSIQELESKDLDSRLATVTDQVSDLEDQRANIEDELDAVRTEREDLEDTLREYEEKETELDSVRDELDDRQAAVEATRQRRDELHEEVTELESTREELQATAEATVEDIGLDASPTIQLEMLDEVQSAIQNAKADADNLVQTLEDDIETVREDAQEAAAECQRLFDEAESLEAQASEHEDRREKLLDEVESKVDEIATKETQLEKKREAIERKRSRFDADDVPADVDAGDADEFRDRVETELDELREKHQSVVAQINTVTERIEHAERLLAEGKCPECGQDVDDAPEVDSLDEDRERLESLEVARAETQTDLDALKEQRAVAKELKNTEAEIRQLESDCSSLEALIDEQRAVLTEKRETAANFAETASEKREEASDRRDRAEERAAERDAYVESLDSLRTQKREAEDRLEQLREFERCVENLEQTNERISGVRNQLSDVESLLEEHQERVAELETRKAELEAALDPESMREVEAKRDRLEARIDELEDDLGRVESELETLRERRGELRAERNRLDELRDRAESLGSKVTALENVVGECTGIQDLYAALRTELRRQNVRQLEFLLNEIFALVYQNDAYARIELSDEYELAVHEKSGEALEPDELSGGEKALFNLSLRCAIYQLLAEGIGSEAPLPPLILDEPTVHLDEEHINRISDLVDRMRQLGVDQTIVVSHEAEIVDSADERIEVIQNPSTNRSQVNVESTDLLVGLSD